MATIVAFHAHPDDEVLLTGGTIAWLAAEGHRVVIVMACDGDMWPGQHQGRRLQELRASAAILGADKAVHLGYADSGAGPVLFEDPPGGTRFARADVEEAAGKLAGLLTGEHAGLLLSYDPQGGYGHPDHWSGLHNGKGYFSAVTLFIRVLCVMYRKGTASKTRSPI